MFYFIKKQKNSYLVLALNAIKTKHSVQLSKTFTKFVTSVCPQNV